MKRLPYALHSFFGLCDSVLQAYCGVAGSCGPPDVWAGELSAKGQLAMAISLQAEVLATTAKVWSNSFLCRELLSMFTSVSMVSLA